MTKCVTFCAQVFSIFISLDTKSDLYVPRKCLITFMAEFSTVWAGCKASSLNITFFKYATIKGFRTFETCHLWWMYMYNSCCTNRMAADLTLYQTLCRFMTDFWGLHCYHPFILHRTQSITNRNWQRRSPGARAKLDQLISSSLSAWSWRKYLCDMIGLFGFV